MDKMLTVGELISLLKKFPSDKDIRVDISETDFVRLSHDIRYDSDDDDVVIEAFD